MAKATLAAAIYSESIRRKHSMPAGQFQVFLFTGGVFPGIHMAIPELWIQTTAQVQGNENQRVGAESRRLRSLCHKQKPGSPLMVPATARDPTKDIPMSTKNSQGSSKLLLLTKNLEFIYSSSQAKQIHQVKVTFIISNAA